MNQTPTTTRRREINEIRTDYLEMEIARHLYWRDTDSANAVRRIAQAIGAPIDEAWITAEVARREAQDDQI